MSRYWRSAVLLCALLLLVGCATAPRKPRVTFDYGPYLAAEPRSVVVAPVVGVAGSHAEDWFLATITEPLAERGYYVFPVRLSRDFAAQAGFTGRGPEGMGFEEYSEERAAELAALFGADAVLYVTILRWDYAVAGLGQLKENPIDPVGTMTVAMDYRLADARGQTIWTAKQEIAFKKGGGMFLVELWNFFADPLISERQTQLAREANRTVIQGQRHKLGRRSYYPVDPMLVGPNHVRYESDRARRSAAPGP